MKNYIPTIEELLRLPRRELDAIFRKAASVASDASQNLQAREVAARTIENVRRCLHPRPPGR